MTFFRLDIDQIRKEANEIYVLVETGKTNDLDKKFQKFKTNLPMLYNNILSRKMSIEEVEVFLDTFNRAQEHFLSNAK